MTTPLFLLRCVQLGISMADMELLSIGLVNDMFVESRNDECRYAEIGTQEDMDTALKGGNFSQGKTLFAAGFLSPLW